MRHFARISLFLILSPLLVSCFSSLGDVQSAISGKTIQAPKNWQFKTKLKNTVSGENQPVILATGLDSELESYTAEVYSDSSCSNKIGSDTIVGGSFEITNIVIPESLEQVGAKDFYGKYRSGSRQSDGCTNLNLSYVYQLNSQLVPPSLTTHAKGPDETLFILSRMSKAIYAIDLSSQTRQVISDDGIGSGVELVEPSDIEYDSQNEVLYVTDIALDALIKINLNTNEREIVSDATTGTGYLLKSPINLFIHSTLQKAYLMDLDLAYGLIEIDLNTGNRTVISNILTRGSGPNISSPEDVIVTSAGDKAYYIDWSTKALSIIDIASGDRSEVSGSGRGVGTALDNPYGLAINSTYSKAYISNNPFGASPFIIEVDIATGNRTVLSSDVQGTGTNLSYADSLTLSSDSTKLYVMDSGSASKDMIEIDLSTGNRSNLVDFAVGSGPSYSSGIFVSRTLAVSNDESVSYTFDDTTSIIKIDLTTFSRTAFSSNSLGTGTTLRSLQGIATNASGSILYATDIGDSGTNATNDAVIAIDTATGNRTKISGEATGSGPNFTYPGPIVLKADDSIAYIGDWNQQAIYSVNLSTGVRTILSDDSTGDGTGPAFNRITQLVLNSSETTLYVASSNNSTIFSVDIATGNRTIISNSGTGSGPNFATPTSIALNESLGKLYVGNANT